MTWTIPILYAATVTGIIGGVALAYGNNILTTIAAMAVTGITGFTIMRGLQHAADEEAAMLFP